MKILSKPSLNASFSTVLDPGIIHAFTFLDFFLPLTISAAILKSSILELVQLPIKT